MGDSTDCGSGQCRRLALPKNGLSGELPEALGVLTDLRELHLGDNELTGHLPSALGTLTELRSLELSFNSLNGPVPSEFGLLLNLDFMYLNDGSHSFYSWIFVTAERDLFTEISYGQRTW